jgi:hypothetical protein
LDKARRTVVEVRSDVHREIRKLALLNDLRIYELANALLEESLRDQEKIKALIRRLKISRRASSPQI